MKTHKTMRSLLSAYPYITEKLLKQLDGLFTDEEMKEAPLVDRSCDWLFGGDIEEIEYLHEVAEMVNDFGTEPDIVEAMGPFMGVTYITNNSGGPLFLIPMTAYQAFAGKHPEIAASFNSVTV